MDRQRSMYMDLLKKNRFLLLAAITLLSQCSPYAGKSMLTFFFDGVPAADSTEVTGKELEVASADSANQALDASAVEGSLAFIHYPYEERECSSCHDQNSLGTMIEPQPGLCYMCHEDLGTQYKTLHGPVAGGYCTSCHDPHSSENEKLLRFTGQQLCFHCHMPESVLKNEMHQDLDGMECTDCHNPHGGEDKYIFH